MYRLPDIYQRGAQIDSAAEIELQRWATSKPEVDHAFEELAEFGPIGMPSDRYALMERDDDPNARYHDGQSY